MTLDRAVMAFERHPRQTRIGRPVPREAIFKDRRPLHPPLPLSKEKSVGLEFSPLARGCDAWREGGHRVRIPAQARLSGWRAQSALSRERAASRFSSLTNF